MKSAKLHILDEVNVKFEGLDALTRRKIVEKCKFVIPYARHMPQFKMGRWDGTVSFATVGGSTYLNLLERVLPIVFDDGYDVDIEDHRKPFEFEAPHVHEGMLSHKVWAAGHPLAGQPIMLRDYQVSAIKTYFDERQCIQSLSTGAGKAQPLWSKIKTPTGWVTMNDVKLGDVISTPDGNNANIIGIYPQGKKDIYRITFKDGRTAEACGDHLWNVYCVDFSRENSEKRTKTVDTNYIANRLKNNKRPLKIELIEHENREDFNFFIKPYLMGALLGDGYISQDVIGMSSKDAHIINRLNECLVNYSFKQKSSYDYTMTKTDSFKKEMQTKPRGQKQRLNPYKQELIKYELFGCKSDSKFIPDDYLSKSSKFQKLQLIQGLMDTDGFVGKNGELSYSTTSARLANDMVELIRSIGGIASIKEKQTWYMYNSEKRKGKLSYTVKIRYKNPKDLVSLPRKLERISDNYQYKDNLKLEIIDVTYIGHHDSQCIMIDHPEHLYITDNYVVTHNTIVSATLSYCVENYGKSIVIVPSKSLVEQTEEDYINLGLDVGVWFGERKEFGHKHLICTWQSLAILSKKTKRQEISKEEVDIHEFLKDVVCVQVDECFDGDSLVLTPSGYRKIKNLCIGDKIINYNQETKQFKEDVIIDVYKNMIKSSSEKMYELKFDNDKIIKVTGNHKFLTNRGWVRADELTSEDDIISIDDYKKYIRRLRTKEKLINFYNELLCEKSIKIVSWDYKGIILNNGVHIPTNKIQTFKNNCINLKKIERIDNLYSSDPDIVKNEHKKIHSYAGKKCQEKNPNIRINLNTNRIPWNKGLKTNKSSWNKGLTKENNQILKNWSISRQGSGNPMYGKRMTDEQKNNSSNRLKNKIYNNEFTPNIHNSNTHWTAMYKNKKYRSSWEAAFHSIHPHLKFENIRIKYIYKNKENIYIVDFEDVNKKIIYEVKPSCHKLSEKNKIKEEYAIRWCKNNNYKYISIDENYICKNYHKIDFLNLDTNSKLKIEKLYETHTKNRNTETKRSI